jgi:hypothetical protein
MTRRNLAVLLILGLLAACGDTGLMMTGQAGQATTPVTDTAPIEGQAGDVEFLLDEDVFTIERSPQILLIALALYLPFLLF